MTKRSSSTRKSVVIEYESKEPDLTKFDEQYNLIKKMRGEGGIAEHATVDKLCLYFPDHHEKLESDEENEAILKIKRYRTLVCLMLSAQTKDTITVQVMEKLMNHGFTVDSLNETSLEDLTKLIFPVGFYKRKAEYIKKATKIVKDKYGGDVPNNVKEMMELPGVGPKMGYLCMNHAWSNVVGIGVDTHVHRISNRLKWVNTEKPEVTRAELEKLLPKDEWKPINVNLVGFGQKICAPTHPKCEKCSLSQVEGLCPYFTEIYPQKKNKKKK